MLRAGPAFRRRTRPDYASLSQAGGRLETSRRRPIRKARGAASRAELLARLRAPLADRYLLEVVIEEGPVASIIRARDVRHGRPVALKVLRPALSAAVEGKRFLREIDTIAGLSHPHILKLIDSGDVEGMPGPGGPRGLFARALRGRGAG